MNESNHDPEGGWRLATRLVRGGTERTPFDETSEGLFLTSGYVYESAEEAEQAFKGEKSRFVYSRYANPTLGMFEKRMAMLEGAAVCRATASGMAAVFAAIMALLKAGDRVVASRALFGSCHYIVTTLLPRYGIETEWWTARTSLPGVRRWTSPPTCVFLETPSNPTLEVIDLPAVAHLAHKAGARVVVDNVFATPILQKPLQLGADVVVYSTTKHIDGQGRTLGGAILTNHTDWVDEHLTPLPAPHRPGNEPVQRLGSAERTGNAEPAGAPPVQDGPRAGRFSGRCAGRRAGSLSRPVQPTRSMRWPRARWARAAPCCPSRSAAEKRRPSGFSMRWKPSTSRTIWATPRA